MKWCSRAYGTETVPAVDKIVGPGNIYVATAKRMVYGTVGIDMIAGPSEILVICDGDTDPDWIAMDLFSQAEHDEDAQAILLSPDGKFLDRVTASLDRLIEQIDDIVPEPLGGAHRYPEKTAENIKEKSQSKNKNQKNCKIRYS